ncbi:MAG: hypothetical protein HQ475_13150 [SAR202 cluster bacterium]|nr:hypothetical protein [SAR202 cluster bacterium]
MAAVIALIIFLGAWAVSADVGGQRTLAFGLPGTTPTLTGENLQGDSAGQFGANNADNQSAVADTWWGQALLTACPLH